ncbi:MAG TPA: low temperature requirement protein A [Candidatus Thermoplasmatota archaeon]|nr:low temperature requirement protein A [Candidatus Thermoplasmatota archaeon]
MPVFVPPRLRSNEPGDAQRRATWLELFYDLVYVVVVAALAHELATGGSVLRFAALFVPVWWSWVGVTLYNDRFDTDDLGTRLITFLQMIGAAALALSIHGAFAAPGFALAYVALRALLIAQYVRVARYVPLARPLCARYALGFSFAAALWLASLLLPAPWRYVLWGVAMIVDIGTPLTARALQAKLPLSTSHLPERIGLFTIIVLGEAVAAIVRGIERPSIAAFLGGGLGLGIVFCLWWTYFDNMEEQVVRKTRVAGQVWFYAHLPLVMGITAAAVGAEELAKAALGAPFDAHGRWLLGGSVVVALLAMGTIHLTTATRTGPWEGKWRASVRGASALLVLSLCAAGGLVPALAFGVALALVGIAQIWLEPARAPAVHAS